MEKWIIEVKLDHDWVMAKTPEGVLYGDLDSQEQAEFAVSLQYPKLLKMQEGGMPPAVRVVCVEVVEKHS